MKKNTLFFIYIVNSLALNNNDRIIYNTLDGTLFVPITH